MICRTFGRGRRPYGWTAARPGFTAGVSRPHFRRCHGLCGCWGLEAFRSLAAQYGPSMRALIQHGYGAVDALSLGEIARPEPAEDEVLIRVRAASVHPDVWHVVAGQPAVLRLMGSGVRHPKNRVPGTDAAGVVESVGAAVTRFRPGDEVFGEIIRGIQWRNGGAFAEYATAPDESVALKPRGVSFEEAAAVQTAGLIALHNLPQHRVQPGDRVLVNGAAGGVGAVAVQLAKAYGTHVTGVDHPRKLELVRSLGADRVIDYTREDYTRGGERWDLIFDVPGNHSFDETRRALAPRGAYVLIGHDAFGAIGHHWLGSIPRMLGLMVRSAVVPELRGGSFASPDKRQSMTTLTRLLETGKLRMAIDRTFPLSQTPAALQLPRLRPGRGAGRDHHRRLTQPASTSCRPLTRPATRTPAQPMLRPVPA
jgi:NADPH:quinone reductase-like Zn-dependent oxidoreductase